MAVRRRDLQELAQYIASIDDFTKRAAALTLMEITQKAELNAVKNVKRKFGKTDSKRTQTGGLLNSIFSTLDRTWVNNELHGFVGTKGIPYGKIHELGGIIRPVNAKNLWIPLDDRYESGKFKQLTPREFMQRKQQARKLERYAIVKDEFTDSAYAVYYKYREAAGKNGKPIQRVSDVKLLFKLAKRVKMKPRPYIVPAIKRAMKSFSKTYQKHLEHEGSK